MTLVFNTCISIPINKSWHIFISPDHLYPSKQSNRWNNTDIGWNDTVDSVVFIVITCIPLDRWNDTDILGRMTLILGGMTLNISGIPSLKGDTGGNN